MTLHGVPSSHGFLKGTLKMHGQRILMSCGAFQVQDFARALNMELLPETIPPTHSTMENSTHILCIAKLLALLPEDFS